MNSNKLKRLDHHDRLAFGETKMGDVVRGMMKADQKMEVLNKGKDKDLEIYRRSLDSVQQSVNATIERQQTSMMQNLRRLNNAKNQARVETARIHKWMDDAKAKRDIMSVPEKSTRLKDHQTEFLCALKRASFPINFKGNISLCIPKITISDYSFCDMNNEEDLLRVRLRTLSYDDTCRNSRMISPDSDFDKESFLHVPPSSHFDERETIKRAQARSDTNICLTLEEQDRICVDNLGKRLFKRSQLYSSNKTLHSTVGSPQKQHMLAVSGQSDTFVEAVLPKASPMKRSNTKSCNKESQLSFPTIPIVGRSQSQPNIFRVYDNSKNVKLAARSASSKNLTRPKEWRNSSKFSSETSVIRIKPPGADKDSLCRDKNTQPIHKTIHVVYCPKDVAACCDQSLHSDCHFPPLHTI